MLFLFGGTLFVLLDMKCCYIGKPHLKVKGKACWVALFLLALVVVVFNCFNKTLKCSKYLLHTQYYTKDKDRRCTNKWLNSLLDELKAIG